MKKKILDIYNSRVKDKSKLGNWYKERIDICSSCDRNTKNINSLNLKQKFIKFANTNKDYCIECGCGVEYKTSIKSEKCPIGKWKEIFTEQNIDDFDIRLDDINDIGVSLENNNNLILNYGTVNKNSDSEVKILLKHKSDLKVKRVLTSCGCTTPKLDKEEKETMLSVKYDTKILGKANRKLEIQYEKDKEQKVLLIEIKINVK